MPENAADVVRIKRRIGRAIIDCRKARGMSRARLARAVGIDLSQLIAYESGSYAISAAKLTLIAHTLAVPVAMLFGRAGE